ncbi:MAG: ATP-binding cassette domain-containing protein [Oscillospiraceae bacterium]
MDAEDLKSVLNGWDEIVGSFNENGAGLSGGQWQKVALARALCKDSARIMILDEPTAAMDPLTEAQLYRNFALLTSGKTTILISHRLGITSLVDRILVFNGGQVVEQGTHKELMENGGLYSQMYRAQAKWYQ